MISRPIGIDVPDKNVTVILKFDVLKCPKYCGYYRIFNLVSLYWEMDAQFFFPFEFQKHYT